MFSNDNKENTYYMSNIPDIVNNNTYLKNEYDKQVGYLGKKWVENPYFSDKTKLDLIKRVKPEYTKEINLLEKGLPYIKKTQQHINKKSMLCFSVYISFIDNQTTMTHTQ